MLPNNALPSYDPNLCGLAAWITDNHGGDPIDKATGRLLQHIAAGYGGLQCDGVLGVDKYMRREGGLDHERLIKLGEYLAVAVMLNQHIRPRPELRPWQTRIGYGGRLLAGATWLKEATSPNDQVGRAIAKLLDHVGEEYADVVVNGRDHHQLLVKLAKQVLFACITDYPRQAPAEPEQAAVEQARQEVLTLADQLGARPVDGPR